MSRIFCSPAVTCSCSSAAEEALESIRVVDNVRSGNAAVAAAVRLNAVVLAAVVMLPNIVAVRLEGECRRRDQKVCFGRQVEKRREKAKKRIAITNPNKFASLSIFIFH